MEDEDVIIPIDEEGEPEDTGEASEDEPIDEEPVPPVDDEGERPDVDWSEEAVEVDVPAQQHFVVQPTGPYHVGDTWQDGTMSMVCIADREAGFDADDWTPQESDYVPPQTLTRTLTRTAPVNDFSAESLAALESQGARAYALYDDGTRVQVPWSEVRPPLILGVEISETQEVANATAQRFWADDNGAHVATETAQAADPDSANLLPFFEDGQDAIVSCTPASVRSLATDGGWLVVEGAASSSMEVALAGDASVIGGSQASAFTLVADVQATDPWEASMTDGMLVATGDAEWSGAGSASLRIPVEASQSLAEQVAFTFAIESSGTVTGLRFALVEGENDFATWEAHYTVKGKANSGYNSLWNSLGMLFRDGIKNLVSITRSAIAFYDGLGNGASNVVAKFGKGLARIGKESESHVDVTDTGIELYNEDGERIFIGNKEYEYGLSSGEDMLLEINGAFLRHEEAQGSGYTDEELFIVSSNRNTAAGNSATVNLVASRKRPEGTLDTAPTCTLYVNSNGVTGAYFHHPGSNYSKELYRISPRYHPENPDYDPDDITMQINGSLSISESLSLPSKSANTVLAAPSESDGFPYFRKLAASDIPALDAAAIESGTLAAARIPNLAASKINSGTFGVARGGTGKGSHTVNSVLIGGTTTTGALQNVAAASGALYSTGANVKPQFGTLPVAQGGTGKTTAADARTALGAASQSDMDDVQDSISSLFPFGAVNLDDLSNTIMYVTNASTNLPGSTGGLLISANPTASTAVQLFVDNTTTMRMYARGRAGGTWRAWKQLA